VFVGRDSDTFHGPESQWRHAGDHDGRVDRSDSDVSVDHQRDDYDFDIDHGGAGHDTGHDHDVDHDHRAIASDRDPRDRPVGARSRHHCLSAWHARRSVGAADRRDPW
jgi:hypothetical protein